MSERPDEIDLPEDEIDGVIKQTALVAKRSGMETGVIITSRGNQERIYLVAVAAERATAIPLSKTQAREIAQILSHMAGDEGGTLH